MCISPPPYVTPKVISPPNAKKMTSGTIEAWELEVEAALEETNEMLKLGDEILESSRSTARERPSGQSVERAEAKICIDFKGDRFIVNEVIDNTVANIEDFYAHIEAKLRKALGEEQSFPGIDTIQYHCVEKETWADVYEGLLLNKYCQLFCHIRTGVDSTGNGSAGTTESTYFTSVITQQQSYIEELEKRLAASTPPQTPLSETPTSPLQNVILPAPLAVRVRVANTTGKASDLVPFVYKKRILKLEPPNTLKISYRNKATHELTQLQHATVEGLGVYRDTHLSPSLPLFYITSNSASAVFLSHDAAKLHTWLAWAQQQPSISSDVFTDDIPTQLLAIAPSPR
eukprot:TRINITY_DN6398_c0_g1_i1.p1 TRINITY_DN6398_c0_g1~~TRINITY_DN6398_c0_g1_i1.p1  ORF type:complete len:344 (+),score=72.37 TRINITY_DN6398_c0_g1_i1:175-1206(+)